MTLQLHGHPFSSYCWKALIPLYANNTPFDFVMMAGDRPLSEQFPGKVHPGGHIPLLVDGETVVVEATSIVEHLAVHHPGPAPLIPADPAEAARYLLHRAAARPPGSEPTGLVVVPRGPMMR